MRRCARSGLWKTLEIIKGKHFYITTVCMLLFRHCIYTHIDLILIFQFIRSHWLNTERERRQDNAALWSTETPSRGIVFNQMLWGNLGSQPLSSTGTCLISVHLRTMSQRALLTSGLTPPTHLQSLGCVMVLSQTPVPVICVTQARHRSGVVAGINFIVLQRIPPILSEMNMQRSAKITLINKTSVTKSTFILNSFMISNEMDFLLMTNLTLVC